MLSFPLSHIAALLQATIEGDADQQIHTLSKIEEGTAGSIAFLANPKYEHYLYSTAASAVIVANDFQPRQALKTTLLRVADPYAAFTLLLQQAQTLLQQPKTGIESPSYIAPSAQIGKEVYIGAFAYIGEHAVIGDFAQIYPHTYVGDGVHIGAHTTLHANVSVYAKCKLGNHCIIHAGVVIGSDGFGHAPQADGSYLKIPQLGNVVIEDRVEIGANTTIDRATMGSTIIKEGVKLDNLIQIAHNVVLGKHTVIAAQTGISGSTQIGENNMIGGQVGFVGHISTAKGVKIGAQSGVSKSIKTENSAWKGSPAQDYNQQLKSEAVFRQLADLMRRVNELERRK